MELYESRPNRIVRIQQLSLGGAHRKFVLTDDRAREWLFKPAAKVQIAVQVAAALVARNATVPSPIVYAIEFVAPDAQLYQGTLQPLLDRVTAYQLPGALSRLTPAQWEALQRHQVLDWLIANPDAHRAQFVIRDATVIAVDKAQSLRFFPHDRLRWDAHAWWANRLRPVYADLFAAAKQRSVLLDPQTAIQFAYDLSARIANDWLRSVWHPAVSLWSPARLFYATLDPSLSPTAATHAILSKLVRRKERLGGDFETLYYRSSRGVWRR